MSRLSPQELLESGPAQLENVFGVPHRWTEDGGYVTPAEWWRALAEALAGEVSNPDELPHAAQAVFAEDIEAGDAARDALRRPLSPVVLADFVSRVDALDRAEPAAVTRLFKDLRSRFRERHDMRGREVMFVVRAALTGVVEGPCLEIVVCLLGCRRCVERVRRQLKLTAGDTK